jgi:tRNA (cytidine/uridine-2'-O-)-methyltransferase
MPRLHVALLAPEIHWNTGNAGRTCLATGAELHLVGPLGFSLDEKEVRRAGLDYWDDVAPEVHGSWAEFEARHVRGEPGRLHLFSARAERTLFEVRFAPGDFLVFGQEQLGLPPALLSAWPERTVSIPMVPGKRSLNLAVSVGVGVYGALRSLSE